MASPSEASGAGAASFSVGRVALVVIPLALVVVAGVLQFASHIKTTAEKQDQEAMLSWFHMTSPSPRRLEAKFSDADQDLVADAPSDPAKQVTPDELIFSYIAGSNAESEQETWKPLAEYLAQRVGKPVRTASFDTADQQLAALGGGRLHVTVCNTGTVPSAVATYGFVPICTLGHDDGSFGTTMKIIVPADSTARSIEDLKGSRIAFTTSDSNSGCKAALALLREHDMLPLRDYLWMFSGGHDESIKGVASKEYPAASVAGDLLERGKANGLASDEQIRTIYESERFPPATFGYVWNLSPELAEKIRAALLEFNPSGSSLEKEFQASSVTKLVPVSYKQDFALIRRIDDAFRKPAATDEQQH